MGVVCGHLRVHALDKILLQVCRVYYVYVYAVVSDCQAARLTRTPAVEK